MRVTLHNGRGSAIHNDRSFNIAGSEHIDPATSKNNVIISYQTMTRFDTSLRDSELRYYKQHFQTGLENRNRRYDAQRHPERIKSIEEFYKSSNGAPEEVILQIGTRDQSVDSETLERIIRDQVTWEQSTYPQVRYLSASIHVDEPGAAPHAHLRRVWVGHDRDGHEIVSQASALREMRVERPDLGKPESRYNNSKLVHTAKCRAHLQELCKNYGIEIETTPRAPGRSGRKLEQLKAESARRAAKHARKVAERARREAQQAADQKRASQDKTAHLQAQARDLQDQIQHDSLRLYELRQQIKTTSRHRQTQQERDR